MFLHSVEVIARLVEHCKLILTIFSHVSLVLYLMQRVDIPSPAREQKHELWIIPRSVLGLLTWIRLHILSVFACSWPAKEAT